MMEFNLSSLVWLLIGLGLFLFLAFVILVIPSFYGGSIADVGSTGDAINGLTAPFIGILAVLTTFLAFFVQYKANEEIRNQFKHERFETKFYELLKLHKENVSEIDIDGKYRGRKSFVWMYKEFRFIYYLCKSKHDELDAARFEGQKMEYNESKLTELAYIIFFFGVGEISDKGIKYYTEDFDNEIIMSVISELKSQQNRIITSDIGVDWYKLNFKVFEDDNRYSLLVNFFPFDGHVAKLAHYYRHIYQVIKFVATENSLGLTWDAKYTYIKTLRAQLSNHEQAMIYYNSFYKSGKIWWMEKNDDASKILRNDKGEVLSYFLDYRIIKNIPFNLTEGLGPDPRDVFHAALRDERKRTESEINNEMKELFEWIGG